MNVTGKAHENRIADGRGRMSALLMYGALFKRFHFHLRSFMSLYLAHAVFPGALLVRPFGNWLCARIAGKRSRKATMVAWVLVMCGGSLLFLLVTARIQHCLLRIAGNEARLYWYVTAARGAVLVAYRKAIRPGRQGD